MKIWHYFQHLNDVQTLLYTVRALKKKQLDTKKSTSFKNCSRTVLKCRAFLTRAFFLQQSRFTALIAINSKAFQQKRFKTLDEKIVNFSPSHHKYFYLPSWLLTRFRFVLANYVKLKLSFLKVSRL